MPAARDQIAAQLRLWEQGLTASRSRAYRQVLVIEIKRLRRALAAADT